MRTVGAQQASVSWIGHLSLHAVHRRVTNAGIKPDPTPPCSLMMFSPPKSALDRALLDIIKSSDLIGMSDASKADKAKKLLAIGADFQTSMYVGHNSSVE